jgi:GrpB-like predicted nucleotidyltransferase (UPF0157 family)
MGPPGPSVGRPQHAVPGLPSDERVWRKVLLREPHGYRRVNVHVRVLGQPNQRYPLLFRDYLRAHPQSARAYATLKKDRALFSRTTSTVTRT